MKEKKGKIFNEQEVQAIIAGKKTMFREVVKTEPQFQVGQEIFVKEASVEHVNKILFKASHQKAVTHFLGSIKWDSARFMKQEQSRITLRIKSVKVEKLRDIQDCLKEGFSTDANYNPLRYFDKLKKKTALQKFIKNWNSTHKKQEHKWEANPWVFVYEFEVIN